MSERHGTPRAARRQQAGSGKHDRPRSDAAGQKELVIGEGGHFVHRRPSFWPPAADARSLRRRSISSASSCEVPSRLITRFEADPPKKSSTNPLASRELVRSR